MCALGPEAIGPTVVVHTASLRSRVIWDVRWAGPLFLLLLFSVSAVGQALGLLIPDRQSGNFDSASVLFTEPLSPSLLLY